ncbi:hypothetical protein WL71_13280 [Burkholderia ubonensis]|uniref:SLC26A/SulP transporter domain-containing protein n=1 Tax=Burkholderia ubonensis TaxID=101571 RepID=A0A107G192_9BURK|nr:hypothetical protein WL70_14255 [Burkholderia ubonensis]KWD85529.1 hypothetical protein WL71_13280 [Burkholderia ubonensis]KWE03199.1 hypothetical protein WL72_04745 [Burkholderia ubonensis]KWE03455.1 hypothetical protein WL73_13935 [Burkholderia ubonensis]
MNWRLPERVAPHLPGIALLLDYQRAWLARDLYAGSAHRRARAGRQSYAQAAGLPAVTGLYASIAALLAYALLGPSRILVLGRIRRWPR